MGTYRRDLGVGNRATPGCGSLPGQVSPVEGQWPPMPLILQGMFVHVKMAGQKEVKLAISHGCQQSYSGLDAKVDVPLFSWLGLKPLKTRSGNSIMMSVN